MVRVNQSPRIAEHILDEVTRYEVSRYVAEGDTMRCYPALDNQNRTYAVVIVPDDEKERPSWVFVMARVVGDYVIIEEDGPPDKPLVEALMVNGGIPREQIILAYKGETIPDDSTS